MEPKKLKRGPIRTIESTDTIRGITKVDPGSRGQTKDLSRKRHLSGLYSKKNSSKRGYI